MTHLDPFKAAADSNTWGAIAPEITLGVLAMVLLVLEMVLPRERRRLIPGIAIAGQGLLLIWLLFFFRDGGGYLQKETFAGMLYHHSYAHLMRYFFLLGALLVCYVATISLARKAVPKVEFYSIVLIVTAAMMLLVQSNHFVMLFIALETVTIGFYVLVSYFRFSSLSLEAGLKFLIQGALSAAVLLFGIALLYGVAGNPMLDSATQEALNFGALHAFLLANSADPIAVAGIVLVLSGVAFKVAAFPFQIWVPDVYQGAPLPVTAFLAVSSKAAGFGILLTLVTGPFAPVMHVTVPLLSAMAVMTILFGNIAALTQRNTKRLMGLSGVAHTGYLLVGVIASLTVPWALGAVIFYLFTYLLGSYAVFGVMAYLSRDSDGRGEEIEDYSDLARDRPFLGAVLAIGLGSLAGIPPLAGFIGKLLIFIAAFQAGLYFLLAVSIFGVVLSIYYYFGWMKVTFFRLWKLPPTEGEEVSTPSWPTVTPIGRLTLGTIAAATVVLGVFQGPLSQWLRHLGM